MLSNKVGLRSWVQEAAHHRTFGLRCWPRRGTLLSADYTSTSTTPQRGDNPLEPSKCEGRFFLDSVFPMKLSAWDFRHYIYVKFRQEENLVERVAHVFKGVDVHGFEVDKVEPRFKDGGMFIHFRYTPVSFAGVEPPEPPGLGSDAPNPALVEIEETLLKRINVKGGLPTWLGFKHGRLWRVRGRPWREDMRRYASHILRVYFEGPDVGDEQIWNILRPYGRIRDLESPAPVPAGVLRSAIVTFENPTSAAIAHNCVHGVYVPSSGKNPGTSTRLSTAYEQPIKIHVVRNWLTSHPRIVVPVVVFLLGTLTYTVFDPIRAVSVQAKIMGWFDYREFAVAKWLRRNALDRLTGEVGRSNEHDASGFDKMVVWRDRQEAESTLKNYLTDHPLTIMFIHGPTGSGKSGLLRSVIENENRLSVVIDCNEIYGTTSDTAMVTSLAKQTGYWPIFSFLNSVNSLIDLVSVGMIGQKVGLSSSLKEQVSQVLEVVGKGLRRVNSSRRKEVERRIKSAENEERITAFHTERRERILHGLWHDGRIDCVAGNVMTELGMGIERLGSDDEEPQGRGAKDADMLSRHDLSEKVWREREYRNIQGVGLLPVVVIKNFAAKAGKEEVCNALADWAAGLISGHIAHVIVVSDNRENARQLAKALPTKPLSVVALADADSASSLSYVRQKLKEGGVEYEVDSEERMFIGRLGGRTSDLEAIIHKVMAGQTIMEAVEDLIQRGVAELRKNAFGEDYEDSKRLSWTRQQAWTVLKLLAHDHELQYHHILAEFPFKGDESSLRAMEHAELISITTVDGRPSTIRPGRPVHRYVFQRLLADKVFQATQDIACNESLISGAEAVIKAAETELGTLKDVAWERGTWANKVNLRVKYLTNKIYDAVKKIQRLEEENAGLKKVLARGDATEVEPQNKSSWPWMW